MLLEITAAASLAVRVEKRLTNRYVEIDVLSRESRLRINVELENSGTRNVELDNSGK